MGTEREGEAETNAQIGLGIANGRWFATDDDPGPLRILAVDDSPSARRVLQGLLFQLGVTTQNLRLASDSAEALQLAQEWSPDVVLLDMELRGSGGSAPTDGRGKKPAAPLPATGDELGRELLRRNPRLPIVVVTALDRDNPRVSRLLKEGAADVIVKPIRAARVQEVLERFGFPKARTP
jgi:CheY-like chemotaxis protein